MADQKPIQAPQRFKSLGLMGFFAITASMVMAIYEYPTFATSGFSLVFFLIVAGFLWFIPVALCAAEMATVEGWEDGGVYGWVSNTLGERWGFAAISFTYLQIAIGFVPMIYFVIGALSYVLGWPELNSDPAIKTIACIIIIWVLAFTQFGGTKYTAKIAKFGFFVGIAFVALLLIGLGVAYLAGGNTMQITMDASTLIPDFTKISTLVVFVAFILSYMGAEASATHVNEMKNPGRDYPLAMFLLVTVAIVLSSLGGLTVAWVVPAKDLSLNAGIVQTFQLLVDTYGKGLDIVVRGIAVLIIFGALAEIASWIVGPSRGMYVTAKDGILPRFMSKVNKHEVPVPLVIFQLSITTIALIVFSFGGGGNMSFLVAMGATVVVYLGTYFLLFIGYLNLVFKHPEKKRAFRIPGGKVFPAIVAICGLVVSLMAFIISFFPPSGLTAAENKLYVMLLVVVYFVMLVIPFIVYALHDKTNKPHAQIIPVTTQNAHPGHFFIHPKGRSPYHLVPTDESTLKQDQAQPKK